MTDYDRIVHFFTERRGIDPVDAPGPATSLLDGGFLDSLAMVEFVEYLEDTFGVTLTEDDIVPEHFDTIDTVAALIRRKIVV